MHKHFWYVDCLAFLEIKLLFWSKQIWFSVSKLKRDTQDLTLFIHTCVYTRVRDLTIMYTCRDNPVARVFHSHFRHLHDISFTFLHVFVFRFHALLRVSFVYHLSAYQPVFSSAKLLTAELSSLRCGLIQFSR